MDAPDNAAIVNRIVDQLDGRDWSPDTLDIIADILRAGGYTIRDVNEEGADDAPR